MKRRDPESRREYVACRNRAEEVKRNAKDESWERVGEQLREDMHGTIKLIYKIWRKHIRDETWG